MLNWFYKWRLWGYSFVCEVLPQSHRDKPCAQSARRQRPCCRPLRRCVSSSKMNVPLTQVALVARPCAPAAQRDENSSSSSRRLAISLCPLSRPLDIEQDCSFRISREKFIMPRWSPSDKLISYKIKMQSSKLRATSFQQVALRDFENSGGSARSGQKTFKKIKFLTIKIKRAHKQFLSRFYILYILHIKIILISLKTCS